MAGKSMKSWLSKQTKYKSRTDAKWRVAVGILGCVIIWILWLVEWRGSVEHAGDLWFPLLVTALLLLGVVGTILDWNNPDRFQDGGAMSEGK